MEWNGHCTHPTRVSKHCLSWVELATYYDSFLGVATGDNLSNCKRSTPCSIFCLGLTQPVFFSFHSYTSAGVLCHTWFYISFSPPLFVVSFVGHFENTMVQYRQDPISFTSRTRWFHINYPLDLRV